MLLRLPMLCFTMMLVPMLAGCGGEATSPARTDGSPAAPVLPGTGQVPNAVPEMPAELNGPGVAADHPAPVSAEQLAEEVRSGKREVPYHFPGVVQQRVMVAGVIEEVMPHHLSFSDDYEPQLTLRTGYTWLQHDAALREQLIACRFASGELLKDLAAGQQVVLEGGMVIELGGSGPRSPTLMNCRVVKQEDLPQRAIPERAALTLQELNDFRQQADSIEGEVQTALGVDSFQVQKEPGSYNYTLTALPPSRLDENGRLRAEVLESIEKLPKLQELTVGDHDEFISGLSEGWCGPNLSAHKVRVFANEVQDGDFARLLEIRGIHALQILDPRLLTASGMAALEQIPWLETLQVSDLRSDIGERLGNEHLANIRFLPRLRTLELTGTAIDDDGLRVLKELRNLRRIVLDGMPVTGAGLMHLSAPEQVWSLKLSGGLGRTNSVKVNGEVVPALKRMTGLVTLEIFNTDIDSTLAEAVAGMPGLARLEISRSPVDSKIGEGFDRLTNLQRLVLSHTEVDDSLADAISKLPELWRVSVTHCAAGDGVIAALANCPKLRYLSLVDTDVTDAGLEAFAARAGKLALFRMSLSGTDVTETGLKHLLQLERLNELQVSRDLDVSDETVAAFRNRFSSFRLIR